MTFLVVSQLWSTTCIHVELYRRQISEVSIRICRRRWEANHERCVAISSFRASYSCSIILLVQEWRYRFARDILSHVAEKMTSVHPVKYSEILELDRKIRAFGPHPFAVHPFPEKYANWKPSYYSMQPRRTAWYIESRERFVCLKSLLAEVC